jgi:hypothetical protein
MGESDSTGGRGSGGRGHGTDHGSGTHGTGGRRGNGADGTSGTHGTGSARRAAGGLGPGRSGNALTELEQAIRSALASATPEQVLRAVAAALPPDAMASSQHAEIDAERFHGRVQKVSVSMPEELTLAIRERTGPGEFSRFVAEAAEKRLRNELLGEYLDDLDRIYGPVPPELIDWAERQWPDYEEG